MPEPVLKHIDEIPFERVPQAENTYIKWVFSPKDGVPNFSMRIFRVEAGGKIPEHSHPWEHEILMLKGRGKIKVGGKEYEVKEGNAIYIPPDEPHEYYAYEEIMFLCMIPNKGVPPELR